MPRHGSRFIPPLCRSASSEDALPERKESRAHDGGPDARRADKEGKEAMRQVKDKEELIADLRRSMAEVVQQAQMDNVPLPKAPKVTALRSIHRRSIAAHEGPMPWRWT